jgi:hypothetical protein
MPFGIWGQLPSLEPGTTISNQRRADQLLSKLSPFRTTDYRLSELHSIYKVTAHRECDFSAVARRRVAYGARRQAREARRVGGERRGSNIEIEAVEGPLLGQQDRVIG